MFVSDLRNDLGNFKPDGTITIAIPTNTGTHEMRAVTVIGHLDHPGDEVHEDSTCDIQTDPWDAPSMVAGRVGRQMQVQDMAAALEKYPDQMHVRIVVPLMTHDTVSHRMLDIVSIGFTVGSGKGSGIQIVTENWNSFYQILRAKPAVEEVEQPEQPEQAEKTEEAVQ